MNYGGCINSCENFNINRGPGVLAGGIGGLETFTGIYYCCSASDNCNVASTLIRPINNFAPRVRSCYTGVGGSIAGGSIAAGFAAAL